MPPSSEPSQKQEGGVVGSYVKNQESANTVRPRRYRRALDRMESCGRLSLTEENWRSRLIYRSLGHRSMQQASFNKSAANQCRLIKLRRERTISLPDLFSSYCPNLNVLDGLQAADASGTSIINNNSTLTGHSSFKLDSRTLTLTAAHKQTRCATTFPSCSELPATEAKKAAAPRRHHTLPRAVGFLINSFKSNNSDCQPNMKSLSRVTEMSATTTSGRPKKKRPSFFSLFSRKKKTDHKSPPTLDESFSHGGSELNLDELASESRQVVLPLRSKKNFQAPSPPTDSNKENVGFAPATGKKYPTSKFSRQGSRRSSRRSSGRRRNAPASSKVVTEGAAATTVAPAPVLTEKQDNAPAAASESEPPLAPTSPPPPLETTFTGVGTVSKSQFTPNKAEPAEPRLHTLTKAVEITPALLETDSGTLKASKAKKAKKEVQAEQSQQTKQTPEHGDTSLEMIFAEPTRKQPEAVESKPKSGAGSGEQKSTSSRTSCKQCTRNAHAKPPKSESKEPEAVPPVPLSAPPDPVAVNTSLSFTITSKQPTTSTIKRLSNFGLSPFKVPPIPVTSLEDSTDSASESSFSSTMPIYTADDLKQRLQAEHKKLLAMFEEWEMLRRPITNAPRADGRSSSDSLMVKQEALLRQHSVVTSLYQQLLAPVVSPASTPSTVTPYSPSLSVRSKATPTRHIIDSENAFTPYTKTRGAIPIFRSRSTFDVNAENNNTKQEPERNSPAPIGTYSPRINHVKRHSVGDALRPRLPENRASLEDSERRYEERKKYYIDSPTVKPVVRNVPIVTTSSTISENGNKRDYGYGSDGNSSRATSRNDSGSYKSLSPQLSTDRKPPLYPVKVPDSPRSTAIHIKVQNGYYAEPPKPHSPQPTAKHNFTYESQSLPRRSTRADSTSSLSSPIRPALSKENVATSSPVLKRVVRETVPSPVKSPANLPPTYTPTHVPAYVSTPTPAPAATTTTRASPAPMRKVLDSPKAPRPVSKGSRANSVSKENNHAELFSSIQGFPAVTLRSVPKPVEKSFNLGRVLGEGEKPLSVSNSPRDSSDSRGSVSTPTSVPPPPPPPPPASFSTVPKAKPKGDVSPQRPAVDGDALRGDMLAEIRRAGGVQFLRSTNK